MSEQILRNKNGSIIGKITIDSYGTQTIWSANGSRLGSYKPSDNVTKDKNGSTFGKGNLLTMFLR